ncbi:hypothetical protein Pth03_75650 [Planotetraspora thailandica]|uniref:Uncharacterized protein n=1 Tax=Planotetraspora thailandica TaxID=487172 RepID=A0A8J4DEY4_9ACTN|nr:hypothetical protein Pth03_75650 [Planotetraspora thailandica]
MVEHTAAISPGPDIGDSWPDEGGAVHRSVGSMEVGHTAPQRTPVAESQRSCQRSSRGFLRACVNGLKDRPETTNGTVNSDVLEHFIPGFRRTTTVERILGSPWPS